MHRCRLVTPFAVALFLVSFFAAKAYAQMPPSSSTTSTPIPGVGHDYLGEIAETVNPVNGSVSIRLNATMPPGRGLTIPFSFAYDSNGVNYVANGSSGTLQWLTPSSSIVSTGGWSNSVPVVTVSEPTWTAVDNNGHRVYCHAFVNYEYQDAHGNRHNLNLTTYAPLNGACAYDDADWPTGFDAEVVTQGGEVPSTGGSILASIPSNASVSPGPITVAEADGTKLYFPNSNLDDYRGTMATFVEDRNGNIVTINPPVSPATNYSYVDTAGRTVLQDTGFAVNPESVTVLGSNAAYTLQWTGAFATPTFSTPCTLLYGNGCQFSHAGWSPAQYGLSRLTLPNGKAFSFTYDSTYNVLKKITYPTGGYISYVWGMNSQAEVGTAWTTQSNNQCTALYGVPVITDRYVSFDGSTNVLHQHFSYSTTWHYAGNGADWTAKQTTVTTTDLVRNTSYNTVYNYSPLAADVPPNSLYASTCCNPVESSVLYHDNDTNGTLLKTVSKTWANPRLLTSQTTTYPGGQADETTWSYNSREQQTEQDDYDFGLTGVGSLLRKTVTNYQAFGNTPLYPNAPSIVDRPCQVITYDNTGTTRVAETDYFYDNGATTTPCGAAGTPSVTSAGGSSLTGHDETNYSASSTYPRGNLTQKTQWLNSGGSSPVTTYAYDTTGQTLSMTDPNGNTTAYSFADSYVSTNSTGFTTTAGSPPSGKVTNAFLTQVTYATVNAIALTENYSYGYNDGELTQSTDENSKTTAFKYDDSLSRLTETDYPDTGQTTVSYNDSTPSVTTTKLITSTPSVNLSTTTVMDSLGHATQTKLTTDPDGTTYTARSYDGNGRTYQLYNPTRCSPPTTKCSSEANSWGVSTNTYDGLGRVKSVAEPDGSAVTTSYSANQITTTDEIGNQRTSQIDGLGRMTNVWEAPNATGYNFPTLYAYDPLNDLTGVTQNGSNSANARIRTFVYDSLSRLTSATNPESGTILYAYDANGNLSTKTAPAPNHSGGTVQTTSYFYDVLNRLTKKSYSDGTPTVQYGYDGVAPTGCTPPSLTDSYPIGRRTAMCDGSGATSWSHDKMGRTAILDRTIGAATRSASYVYNLDGSLYQETIFSGKQLQYTYGGAGRVLSVTDPSNNPVFNFVTGAKYSPNGALATAVYGAVTNGFTGVTETDAYNDRLQPVQRLATSSAGTAINLCYDFHLKVAITSSCSFPAGGGDNGNVFQIVNSRDATRTQNFTYDKLNRITSATSSLWGTTYVVDSWGNLTNITPTNKTYQQNPLAATASTKNQLSGFCEDAAGNTVFYTTCPPPQWSMTPEVYDAENRLKTVIGAANRYVYIYDGDGNRVEKLTESLDGQTIQSGTIYWRESDGELTNETDLNNVTLHRHVYFNGRRVCRTDTQPSTTQHYYFSDHLGSANVVVSGTDGSIENDSDFYPYGGELVFTNSAPQNYKYTGKERDTESGLDNFGARYYASTMGRFMTPDWATKPTDVPYADFGNPQSLNLYSYVNNNPTTTRDPDGHCIEDACVVEGLLVEGGIAAWNYFAGAGVLGLTAAAAGASPSGNAGFVSPGYPSYYHGELQNANGTSIYLNQNANSGSQSTGQNAQQAPSAQPSQSTPAQPEPPSGNDLNRSSSTKQTGKQGQNTETTVTEASGSTTYKTTPGKTGGQSTMVVRKDANGNTVYVKQEARTNNKDFTKPPDHVHYKKPIDKEVN
jgi:RHS repeat-associated protein